MKPVTSFENFPSFANAGTRNAPGEAKYGLGFVPADTLPAEWANYFFHGSTKGISDLNAAVQSIWQELASILMEYGITASAESTSQVLAALNKIYPQFASCSTAANMQVKSVAINENVLKAGNLYVIDMTNGNSYGDGVNTYPTLSINSGTAYPICNSMGKYAKAGAWEDGQTIKLLFTGTKFLMSAAVTESLESGNQNAPTSDAVNTAISNIGASIIGEIKIWPGSTVPSENWMFCFGQELSRTEYATIFSIVGVSFGSGDGVNTFNLPDLRECVLVGAGQNSTDVIATHDVYTVGEFKDDRMQDHRHFAFPGRNGQNMGYFAGNTGFSRYENGGVENANSTGQIYQGRKGTTTHGKQKGVNYIIRVK